MLAEPGKRRESRVWCVQFARVETAFVDQREPIDGFCALRAPKCIQLENAQKRSENCVDFFSRSIAIGAWISNSRVDCNVFPYNERGIVFTNPTVALPLVQWSRLSLFKAVGECLSMTPLLLFTPQNVIRISC